jgi:hypothetical protein
MNCFVRPMFLCLLSFHTVVNLAACEGSSLCISMFCVSIFPLGAASDTHEYASKYGTVHTIKYIDIQ